MAAPLFDLLPPDDDFDGDDLLGRFLDFVADKGLTLYPAQEEAVLELFQDKNVILNTPTGSGKSLVASALHFASMACGHRSVYTCPIKALVNEKWMALCRELGPENVGLATGDATVNRDAPVLCCTAEILANMALREGEDASDRRICRRASAGLGSAGWGEHDTGGGIRQPPPAAECSAGRLHFSEAFNPTYSARPGLTGIDLPGSSPQSGSQISSSSRLSTWRTAANPWRVLRFRSFTRFSFRWKLTRW